MPKVPQGKSFSVLAILLLICVGGGAVIGVVTAGGISTWYAQLNQPSWTPPNWLFGPVWTALYTMMAISMWLVWRTGIEEGKSTRLAATLFGGQLAFNFLWTPMFFSFHQMEWALAIIVLLWFLIGITIFHFKRYRSLAAGLLIPYLLWVTYATSLNAGFVWLNR